MDIRPAEDRDLSAILAFWNPIIRETTIVFSSEERTPESLGTMISARRAAGREMLVAEDAGEVLGIATYDQFRGGLGYVHAMEHTVMLAPDARGRGVGRALMAAIEDHARARGGHTMVAAVDAANAEGIGFHEAIGYARVGYLPESGRKFGRWLDLVLLQKIL
ncbi:phosphinothricin acetyltransferase [Paracoccus aminovorans]|uniref:Phosphinothricin acetyltransferase n=1 Tax=Paracoccus aminovorans TaxID=34004 RepID=A0A1I2Y830_9RHOB|nr:GNAT family N-acetyltransferase [Paracoccus aminovorans]CQR86145.1 GNAT family acetyltransferase [Paracoccus aminovorans]SFH21782.1 phosphinothricin acetyltransferase [Paracoccus aminovorans]